MRYFKRFRFGKPARKGYSTTIVLRHSKKLGLSACAVALIGVSVGCDDDRSVQSYQTPKEDVRPAQTFGAPGAVAPPMAAAPASKGPALRWTVPAGWKEQPPQNMESQRFAVAENSPQTVFTVVPLGGMAGGMLMNVQRWQGQLKLPPATEADLPKLVTRIDVSGMPVDVVDLSQPAGAGAEPPQRILAAVLPRDDRTWFFKLMGPADVVATQKPAFDAFIQSLHFDSGESTPAPAPVAGPPTPGASAQGPMQSSTTGALKAWATPDGWAVVPNGAPFRVVTFNVQAGGRKAEAVISKLPAAGNMGTLLDNINRWRGQVGLAKVADEKEAAPEAVATATKQQGVLFDFTGPQAGGEPAKRMLIAMTRVGDDNWYIKLTGPADLVAAQKPAFVSFVQSLQFGGE